MVLGASREIFTVVAEAAATLTGLLFIAMSLAPRHESTSHLGVVQQVRAAASLLAFTSALSISLFALVSDDNVGYPALVLGIVGVSFTAASVRSIYESSPIDGCCESRWVSSCCSSRRSAANSPRASC